MAEVFIEVIATLLMFFLFALAVLFRWEGQKGWPRRIALSGYFLPVLIGICVHEYLQVVGKPMMGWDWIFTWFYMPHQFLLLT